jgi:glycosyltransferase involved in cell wall biosynthesis
MYSLPRISIITPAFNASSTLKDCIESVSSQNYPSLEHLIIDGLSTDNTLKVINKYKEKYHHIKYISEKDKGIFDAMNKGINISQGEWLLFLGADDKLYPNVLYTVFNSVAENELDLIYGKVKYLSYECGKFFSPHNVPKEQLKDQFIHLYMHHQGTLIKKSLFARFGLYDLKYKLGADVYFFIKTINNPAVNKKFVDVFISEVGANGASSRAEEMKLRHDFPTLSKKYLSITIDTKAYYRNLAKYYFHAIAHGNVSKGIWGIVKIIFNVGDGRYYLANTLYWLKYRLSK